MHRFICIYSENNCGVKIKGKKMEGKLIDKPYMVLNLEEYFKQNGINKAHCDFVYVVTENNEFIAYVVELKEINDLSEKVEEDIRKSLQNKFFYSLEVLENNIVKSLGLRGARVKYHAILVIPEKVIDRINAIIKRDKLLLRKLKKFSQAWITKCCGNILDRYIVIKSN